jgi:hypothetical protein
MLRKPPGAWFIGMVACLCAYAIVTSWTLGGTVGVYGLSMIVGLLLGVLATVVRIGLAVGGIGRTPASLARVCAGPALLVVTVLLVLSGTPERVRLALSENALDDYARTVTATECTEESFRPRRVGMYSVTCAQRPNGGAGVFLTVRDRLTPDRTGVWYLSGPDPWELGVED